LADGWISDAADTFSAVGTVGAFVVGFVLLRKEQRRKAGRSERQSQAARISAWVELHRTPDGSRELAFRILNASDMPIYEVGV